MAPKRTVLITGCSKGGLGDALARAFHARGFRVFATGRNLSKLKHFESLDIETLQLDVLSADSIAGCVSKLSALTGGTLDILLNNSGGGSSMPMMDVNLELARELFELNTWSILTVSQAFIPLIVKSSYGGMIVNNTSIASIAGVPMQGVYNASKAAAASLSETMRFELAPFGIKVVDMKTGAVKSNIFVNMRDENGASAKIPEDSLYSSVRQEVEGLMNGAALEPQMKDADVWAKAVVSDLTKRSPPVVVWRGGSASLAWFGKTWFPQFLWDKIVKEKTGMNELEKKMNERGVKSKQV